MRIEHIIDSDTKARLGVLEGKRIKSNPKKKNVSKGKQKPLSERELRELMDSNKRGFKRHRGAWRSK